MVWSPNRTYRSKSTAHGWTQEGHSLKKSLQRTNNVWHQCNERIHLHPTLTFFFHCVILWMNLCECCCSLKTLCRSGTVWGKNTSIVYSRLWVNQGQSVPFCCKDKNVRKLTHEVVRGFRVDGIKICSIPHIVGFLHETHRRHTLSHWVGGRQHWCTWVFLSCSSNSLLYSHPVLVLTWLSLWMLINV